MCKHVVPTDPYGPCGVMMMIVITVTVPLSVTVQTAVGTTSTHSMLVIPGGPAWN